MSNGGIGSFGKFLGVSTGFIAAPLSPVVLAMPFEFILSRDIDHLDPILLMCIIFGYVAMFFLVMPLYLLAGKVVPNCSTVVKVGATVGALIPMVIIIPLVFFLSLDDNWWSDIQDLLGFLVVGALCGSVSGSIFWLCAYSWRYQEPPAAK